MQTGRSDRDGVLPIAEAGRARIVGEEAVIAEVLHLEHAPGHRPGHAIRADSFAIRFLCEEAETVA